MYGLLRSAVNNYSSVKKALIFGGLIFGIDWLLFNFFAILFVSISPWELLLQAGTDILLMIIGIFVYEKFVVKTRHICSAEFSGALDNRFRKLVHNPEKILQDYVKDGMAVLDMGCGPGFFTLPIAEMVGDSGKVIAADFQAEMLEKLRNKIKDDKLRKRIILHQTAVDRIGVIEEIDLAFVFYMLHEAPDQRKFLEELKSIIKQGGKILLVEPKFHVSKKKFDNFVNIAVALGFQLIEKPKIFFSRAVIFLK